MSRKMAVLQYKDCLEGGKVTVIDGVCSVSKICRHYGCDYKNKNSNPKKKVKRR